MQDWVDENIAAGGDLAIAAMTIKDGVVALYSGGTISPGGPAAGERTAFQIGSISKVFTNLLLAEMVATGDVGYDTRVGELLGADFRPKNPAIADITLASLATHTSGLPRVPANLEPSNSLDPYEGYDEALLLAGLAATRERQPLGNAYAYSNFGVGLLGYLLGQVHGGGYHAALIERVIEPLGLEQTGFDLRDDRARGFRGGDVVHDWGMDDALAGAGALWGSAADFARFASVLLGERASGLAHDLAGDLAIAATTPYGFEVTRVWHVSPAGSDPIFWHNGGTGGFWSFFGFRPATRQALAVLVAGETEPTDEGLARLGHTPVAPTPTAHEPDIAGQYRVTEDFGIGVFEMGGVLVAQASGQEPTAIAGVGDGWYALDVVDASLRFTREDDEVTGLDLVQNGALQRAEKVAAVAASQARKAIDLDRAALADYVGEFRMDERAVFTLRVGSDGLEARLTGQSFYPIYPAGRDRFFYKVIDAELHFERDADGQVDALVLHQGASRQRAQRTALA